MPQNHASAFTKRFSAINTWCTPPQPRLTSLSHGGGCGCKIAPGLLSDILKSTTGMPIPKELLVGIDTSDDAAVYPLNVK
jgi:selenide,water dikinase